MLDTVNNDDYSFNAYFTTRVINVLSLFFVYFKAYQTSEDKSKDVNTDQDAKLSTS